MTIDKDNVNHIENCMNDTVEELVEDFAYHELDLADARIAELTIRLFNEKVSEIVRGTAMEPEEPSKLLPNNTIYKTIYKYPLQPGIYDAPLPKNAELLYVDVDGNGTPCLWALVNVEQVTVTRRLCVNATGVTGAMAEGVPYVGTVKVDEWTMFHVFDLGEV